MAINDVDKHDNCFRFEVDFETKAIIGFPVGRLVVGNTKNSYVVRMYFSPKGLSLRIPQEAIDSGMVTIAPKMDEIQFAGYSPIEQVKK